MPIITISRGSASGGMLLAQKLAERLDYRLVSREDVIHDAGRYGVAEARLQDAILKPFGFWERFQHERRRYLAFVQATLCEHASRDNVVYHGNAGQLLLRGVAHVLCVRLIAPLPLRIEMLLERQSMSPEEALQYVERMDRQREDWTRFLYGVEWLDPSLYDLTINLRTLSLDSAVQLAVDAASRPEFQATAESRAAMADLLLASRVQAALAADEETATTDIEVHAQGGLVSLRGKVRTPTTVEAVLRIVSAVPGVTEIDRIDLDAPVYTV